MIPSIDSYKHKGLRQQLVNQLRAKGISDETVLDALNTVPRHFFLDSAFEKMAYEDRAFPIAAQQTISQPYTVAFQTQLLGIQPNQKVLEVGTGSVYQACVLAQLGAVVFSIERQKTLFDLQKKNLYKNKFSQLKLFFGDGFEGLPTYAQFDKILITAAAPFVPPKLVEQLAIGGCIVLPLSEGSLQRMIRITKQTNTEVVQEQFDFFSFVPMLVGKAH